jgi:hypothetical protein
VAEAIETVVPLRRCTAKLTARTPPREGACAPAQLGVASCPCAGLITRDDYAAIVARAVRGLTVDAELILAPLRARMEELAAEERFEEAADVRDRAAALAQALRRQRRLDTLRGAGRLVIDLPGQGGATFVSGRLEQAWVGPDEPLPLSLGSDVPDVPVAGAITSSPTATGATTASPTNPSTTSTTSTTISPRLPGIAAGPVAPVAAPVPCDLADELFCVASWLDANANAIRLVHCDGGLSSSLPRVPSFDARERSPVPRR